MFNPKLLRAVERLVPDAVLRRLDPFDAAIDGFVRRVAVRTPPGAVVLDAGAGESRFRGLFAHATYIGIDSRRGDADWDYSQLSAVCVLETLPIADATCDRVLSVVVLEHTEQPGVVLSELGRVLKPGGSIHIVVPQMWEQHQQPHDYFRFTSSGLRYLVERAGFELVALEPVGGFFWLLGRRLMGVLGFAQQGWRWVLFPFLAPIFGVVLPLGCFYLDRLDRDRAYTLGYTCEARRREVPVRERAAGALS